MAPLVSDYQVLQAICREDFASFAKKAFTFIEPGTPFEYSWHLGCIAAHLQAQFEGDEELRKLVINIPPRCLKSVMVAQLYPAWVLGKQPHHQFIGAAYAHSLAERNVMKTRQILKHEWYMDTFKNTVLAQDQKDYFTTTQNGQYKGTGIGGTVTGFGCFVGDTEVITDNGIMRISDIKLGINCSEALSYNHQSDTLEWKEIQATRCILSDYIYEISTATGTKINCTGNHPVYTQRGYVRADHLCEGDTIIEAYLAHNSQMCGMQPDIYAKSGRGCNKQHPTESSNTLQQLPHYASQKDTIVMVRQIRSESVPVYDLQVADNHNFFANSILVHNCKTLLIDDPISPRESGSDTVRLTAINEIRSTLFSRFNKFSEGRLTLIMQRLHEQDPAGDLLKDGGYYLLKLPAENKGKTISYSRGNKTWTMEPGELLTPRLTRKDLDELMLNLTEYNYVGQYLQDPVPLGGGEFKESWLQLYHQGAIKPREMNVVILMDQAGGEDMNKKKKKLSDWTVIVVIGLAPDNNYYLLDMVRDKWNSTDRINTLFMMHRKWNALCGKPPKVGVEQIGMMTDAHYIREKHKQDAYYFSVTELGGTQIKEERIKWLVPVMQQHRFYIPGTLPYVDSQGRKFDLIEEMEGEMRSFPKARWDDILDAISRLGTVELCLTFPKPKATMLQKSLTRQEAPDDWENW